MMSMALIPPGPQLREIGYACWRGGFDAAALERIVTLGESLPKQSGKIFSDPAGENLALVEKQRRCQVSWIEHNEASDWLYRSLAKFAADLNARYFGFDLFGFVDNLQYTVYEKTPRGLGHYDWHIDMGLTAAPRKLSISVNLTDPSEYEGGNLEFRDLTQKSAPRDAGHVHAFPSWAAHRVTPVTKGIRRTLVGWISGPPFR